MTERPSRLLCDLCGSEMSEERTDEFREKNLTRKELIGVPKKQKKNNN